MKILAAVTPDVGAEFEIEEVELTEELGPNGTSTLIALNLFLEILMEDG